MSEEVELKLKRRIQIVVVAAMSLFFVLATIVVFQFAIRMYQDAQIRALDKANRELEKQIQLAIDKGEYYSSSEFKYDYALRHLYRGRPGDIVIL